MHITLGDPTCSAPPGLAAMQQHPHYARALLGSGTECVAADFRQGGVHLARAQIYTRRIGPLRVFWLPRGPVWATRPDEDLHRHAMRGLRRAVGRSGLWLVSGDEPDPRCRGLGLAPPLRVAETGLGGGDAARCAALHPRWRNHLRRAERSGLDIEERPLRAGDSALLQQEMTQRRARRYAALPPAFAEGWAARMPTATRLFIARADRTPIAFMLFLLHAPVASYHIGWTGPEGRRTSAHALLLWHASSRLADGGFLRLDLGRLDPLNPGLTEFKLRSGAVARDLGATRLLWPG